MRLPTSFRYVRKYTREAIRGTKRTTGYKAQLAAVRRGWHKRQRQRARREIRRWMQEG